MGLLTQIMKIKNCIQCNKEFTKGLKRSNSSWKIAKYCSFECCIAGRKVWNKGKGDYAKKLGFGKWMNGKKQSVETRRKKSEAAQNNINSGLHNFYIDGRTPERMVIRHSLDYKLWREAVFKRDDFTCKDCKTRGVYLEAHHIKPFALFPELRFAIDNGVTLCTPCHAKVDILRARTLSK